MTRDTTPTERRAYERPEIGDDWAQAWDELVEDVDGAALFDEPGEIDTNNLSDDAVTAAKIAAAAVESGAIADDAVGVDELATALGTSETEQIQGTTYFENSEHDSLNTESLVIGGTLYEEDDNSPLDVSNESTHTYNVAGDYHEIIILNDPTIFTGFDRLQVNGYTDDDYAWIRNNDSRTSGESEWEIPIPNGRGYLKIRDIANRLKFSAPPADDRTGLPISGRLSAGAVAGDGINQFTLFDSEDQDRDERARVYGRRMDI